MKKLTQNGVEKFAKLLFFTTSQAKDITDLFYSLAQSGHWALRNRKLDTADDYIRTWEDSWFRQSNMEECYKDDMNGAWGEILDWTFEEFLDQTLNQTVFQLPNNEMVIEVV